MLKNQLFGVEVEMTGITRKRHLPLLQRFLAQHHHDLTTHVIIPALLQTKHPVIGKL